MPTAKDVAGEITQLLPKLMKGVMKEFLLNDEITSSQRIILVSIYEHKSCTVGAIAKENRVSAPTVTGLVDRLLKGGYVCRGHDSADRRKVIVRLTDKGNDVVKKFLRTVRKRWAGILTGLNNKEREVFAAILKKLMRVFYEMETADQKTR